MYTVLIHKLFFKKCTILSYPWRSPVLYQEGHDLIHAEPLGKCATGFSVLVLHTSAGSEGQQ